MNNPREALEAGLTAALTLEVITAKSEPETSANCKLAEGGSCEKRKSPMV